MFLTFWRFPTFFFFLPPFFSLGLSPVVVHLIFIFFFRVLLFWLFLFRPPQAAPDACVFLSDFLDLFPFLGQD